MVVSLDHKHQTLEVADVNALAYDGNKLLMIIKGSILQAVVCTKKFIAIMFSFMSLARVFVTVSHFYVCSMMNYK